MGWRVKPRVSMFGGAEVRNSETGDPRHQVWAFCALLRTHGPLTSMFVRRILWHALCMPMRLPYSTSSRDPSASGAPLSQHSLSRRRVHDRIALGVRTSGLNVPAVVVRGVVHGKPGREGSNPIARNPTAASGELIERCVQAPGVD